MNTNRPNRRSGSSVHRGFPELVSQYSSSTDRPPSPSGDEERPPLRERRGERLFDDHIRMLERAWDEMEKLSLQASRRRDAPDWLAGLGAALFEGMTEIERGMKLHRDSVSDEDADRLGGLLDQLVNGGIINQFKVILREFK